MARRKSDSNSDGFIFKTGIFALLAGISFWVFNQFSGKKNEPEHFPTNPTVQIADRPASTVPDELLPTSTTGAVLHQTYYALSYSEDHEQAEWVAYELTRDRLNANWVERATVFRPDPNVRTESATPRDYTGSGYDRGHLVPAADMAFDTLAMNETFLMSNISPQERAFNGGVWRELEECVRDWARKFDKVYVATGPVLTQPGKGQIGFNKVTVPAAYYKVVLAPKQHRAIAFVLPNAVSDRPLMEYACTIDRVEALTGIDFFPKLLSGLNEELEGSMDKDAWPISSKRYEKRLREWNRR